MKELFKKYEQWCKDHGYQKSQKTFKEYIDTIGLLKKATFADVANSIGLTVHDQNTGIFGFTYNETDKHYDIQLFGGGRTERNAFVRAILHIINAVFHNHGVDVDSFELSDDDCIKIKEMFVSLLLFVEERENKINGPNYKN